MKKNILLIYRTILVSLACITMISTLVYVYKSYYDKLLPSLIKVIDEDECDSVMKSLAAFLLILSQTGLRISECLDLEIDSLKSIALSNGETAYYLKYRTWKREKKNNVYSVEETYVNALTKKGYDSLVSLYDEKRKSNKTKYLFLGDDINNTFPLSSADFRRLQIKLYVYLNKFFISSTSLLV